MCDGSAPSEYAPDDFLSPNQLCEKTREFSSQYIWPTRNVTYISVRHTFGSLPCLSIREITVRMCCSLMTFRASGLSISTQWRTSNTPGHNTHVPYSGFRHPGTYPKKPGGFFWVDPPKKPPIKPTKKPTQLKSDFVLCATNKQAFYRFKWFKPMNTEFIFLQLL